MILNQEKTLFLIVDIQEKLLNAVFNKEVLKNKSVILTKVARILDIPVVITEQYPKGLGNTVEEIKSNIFNATYFEKTDFNALTDDCLYKLLKDKEQIVIMGIEAHICVYQTAMALLNEKFSVTVVKDACGSRQESEYENALEVLEKNGAQIKTAEMIIFELLKSAKHPNFKEIQTLIK